jgi:protein phosphatase
MSVEQHEVGAEKALRCATSANEIGVEVAVASDAGKRKTNADAFLIDEAAGLFAVCDGVGDTPRSGLVAHMALDAVHELFPPPWSRLPLAGRSAGQAAERLILGGIQANERLLARRRSDEQQTVTTFAGVVVCAEGLCIGHAGDSRVYLFRPSTGKLVKVTEDDTVANDAFWRGVPCDIATAQPNAHAITRALGLRRSLELLPNVHRWATGDVVLVCTDGVTDRLESTAITRALLEPGDIAAIAQRLVERAIEAGGHDNATVIAVRRVQRLADGDLIQGGDPRIGTPDSTVGP